MWHDTCDTPSQIRYGGVSHIFFVVAEPSLRLRRPAQRPPLVARSLTNQGGRVPCPKCVPMPFSSLKSREADAQVCRSLHPVAVGGGALQHRRSNLHRQRDLSRFLWQRGQHGGVSSERGGAGHCGDDRRRRVRVRVHQPGGESNRRRPPKRRQRRDRLRRVQYCADGHLSGFYEPHPHAVRRQG